MKVLGLHPLLFWGGMRWQEWHEDAPKGQHHLAQGSALGEGRLGKLRPVRAVSFIFIMVLPLQGAISFLTTTQGAALGYEVLPLQGVFYLTGITSSASWSRGDERRTRMSCGRLPSAFSGAPPSGPKPCWRWPKPCPNGKLGSGPSWM